MPPLILITRPAEDAGPLIDGLRAAGFDSLVEPMLRIEPVPDAPVDLDGCRAVLFTSANGVRAFAERTARRDLPVLTVGAASARAARDAGFEDVEAAGGNADLLAERVRARFDPGPAPLFHAAGSVVAGDLKAALEADGYSVRRVPLYTAEQAQGFSEACRAALDSGRIAGVTFFSPRTAETFVRLMTEEGRASRARTVWALCLSDAVAQVAGGIDWAGIRVATVPETDALIARAVQLFFPPDGSAEHANEQKQAMGGTPLETGAMANDKKSDETDRDPADAKTEAASHEMAADEAAADVEARNEVDPDDASNEKEPDGATAEPASDLSTDAVIEAFGGIRPMASKLDIAVSTVQGWKTRGHIPENRWRDIIAAASANDIDLSVALPDANSGGSAAATPEADDAGGPETSPWQQEADGNASAGTSSDGDRSDQAPEAAEHIATAPPPETAEPIPAAAPAPSKSGGGGLALVVGIVAVAAVVTRPVWAPYVDPYLSQMMPPAATGTTAPASDGGASGTGVAALEDALAEMRARVADLESRPVASGEGGSAVPADLADRVAALEDGLTALRDSAESLRETGAAAEAALAETRSALQAGLERDEATRERLVERLGVLESRVARISEEAERATARLAGAESRIAEQDAEIAALEARPAIQGAAQAGIALAVGDVEAALADGRPFASALARISNLAESGSPIAAAAAPLQAHAAGGVPTRAGLIAAFRRDVPAIQAELGQTDGDIVTTLLEGARSLISVRRKGETPDAPPVSRAEAALDRGDLASAVAAVSPEAENSETLRVWLADAEARLTAEAALDALRSAVAASLNPGNPNPGNPNPGNPNLGGNSEEEPS